MDAANGVYQFHTKNGNHHFIAFSRFGISFFDVDADNSFAGRANFDLLDTIIANSTKHLCAACRLSTMYWCPGLVEIVLCWHLTRIDSMEDFVGRKLEIERNGCHARYYWISKLNGFRWQFQYGKVERSIERPNERMHKSYKETKENKNLSPSITTFSCFGLHLDCSCALCSQSIDVRHSVSQ